jgi:A/G-specific adenine glycosylase
MRPVVVRVLAWYRKNGRTLPWRYEHNPYRVLVSEVMLQQTQVSRVLDKYPRFLKRFPSFPALSSAKRAEVIRAWQGMGYNNRAVRLHTLARLVVNRHNGRLPRTYELLIALPGIGRYTASAILSSVFDKPVPVVDINIQRVLSRVFWRMGSTSDLKNERVIWPLAFDLLPRRKAYDWNQAMMDLGATICTARRPRCADCPLAALCASRPSMKLDAVKPARRRDPLHQLPDRIYRGRVVEQLRHAAGNGGVRLDRLGPAIRHDFSATHHAWLLQLIEGLKRDGLIRVDGNGSRKNQRVTLA